MSVDTPGHFHARSMRTGQVSASPTVVLGAVLSNTAMATSAALSMAPVSYTHLTLPTILRV